MIPHCAISTKSCARFSHRLQNRKSLVLDSHPDFAVSSASVALVGDPVQPQDRQPSDIRPVSAIASRDGGSAFPKLGLRVSAFRPSFPSCTWDAHVFEAQLRPRQPFLLSFARLSSALSATLAALPCMSLVPLARLIRSVPLAYPSGCVHLARHPSARLIRDLPIAHRLPSPAFVHLVRLPPA